MNPIPLTDEHKTKLLEMCKVLFPEYQIWTFQENCQLGAYSYDFNNLLFSNELEHHLYKAESIHWFEFCITHLATAIYNKMQPAMSIRSFRGYICQEADHPVEFLYEQFKQLK